MATVSLATLEARVRERADMLNSQFVSANTNSVWGWIQEGAQKLHDLLVEKDNDEWFQNIFTFSTVANQSNYPLPADFYRLQSVDIFLNGTGYPVDMKKFNRKERNAYRLAANQVYGAAIPRYRVMGNQFYVFPAPPSAYQITLWYAPPLQVAVHGGGTIANVFANTDDTITFTNGWERYIVAYATKLALQKEESDVSEYDAEMADVKAEIEVAAENRDMAEPDQAVDVDKTDLDPRIILSVY